MEWMIGVVIGLGIVFIGGGFISWTLSSVECVQRDTTPPFKIPEPSNKHLEPLYPEGSFRIVPYGADKYHVEEYNLGWGSPRTWAWRKVKTYTECFGRSYETNKVFSSVSEAQEYIDSVVKLRKEQKKYAQKVKEHEAKPPIYYNPDVS